MEERGPSSRTASESAEPRGLETGQRVERRAQLVEETVEETVVEETVVVSANRDEVPAEQVGSSVTVVGQDEVERRNPLLLLDLLRTIPGVEITQSGGPGQAASVRVRGGSAAQTLVVVDGIRLNTVNNGDVDFAHIVAVDLERIEVLRGPQATYGSEAMSGVISLTTRRGRSGFHPHGSVEAGTHEHLRSSLGLGGATERVDYRASASAFSTDAVSQISAQRGGVETDPYDNRTLTARLGLAPDERARVDLSVRDTSGDTSLDGFGLEDTNAGATTDTTSIAFSAQNQFSETWNQTVRLGNTQTTLLGTDPDTTFNNYDIRSQSLSVETQADLALSPKHLLNAGVSHERREGANLGSFDRRAQLDAIYLQDQFSPFDTTHLTAAVRHDDHSVLGGETSFRVTASQRLGRGHSAAQAPRLRASYGTAFRAPNFNELYFPFAGDATLRPETSRGWDVGWTQPLGSRASLDLAVFSIEFDHLIQFDLSSFRFASIASASSSGVETALRYRVTGASEWVFTHTINDTLDRDTRTQLARRPRNRTSLVVQWWSSERFSAALSAFAVSGRIDATGLPMDDYERVDLGLRLKVRPWLAPFVRIENVFDRGYEEVPGFTTPGTVAIVGVALGR